MSSRLNTLLAACLERPRSYLFAWPERVLSADQWQEFQALLRRRLGGEPLAYILGEREFWSLNLRVSPHTLIPRPETELLVERALALLPADSKALVADLGTGSGAIALALASQRPTWQIVHRSISSALYSTPEESGGQTHRHQSARWRL